MRRLSVLKTWQAQQESKFENLKQRQFQKIGQHKAHEARLALLESFPNSYQLECSKNTSALSLKGMGLFRNQVDSLAKLQRQELSLSEVEMRAINSHIIEQHRQIKMVESVVNKRQQYFQGLKEKQEQKELDELSILRFSR